MSTLARRRRSLLASFDVLEPRQHMSAVSWDGGAGTSNWNDPKNWTSDTLPAIGDEVTINSKGSDPILFNGGSEVVKTLTSNVPVEIRNASLTVTDSASVAGLTINNGTLDGSGAVTVNGAFYWFGGTMTGSARTTVNGVSTLGIVGANYDEVLGGTRSIRFNNDAKLTATSSNWGLNAQSTANRIEVAAGRTFTIDNNVTLYGSRATLSVEQGAQITHTGATGQSTVGWDVTTSGVTYVAAGTLNFDAAFTVTAVGIVQPISGGTIGLGGAATINGATGGSGVLRVYNGVANFNGSIGQVGTLSVINGTANFNAACSLPTFGGGVEITGGLANFSSGEEPLFTNFLQSGGTLTGSDTVHFVSNFDWHGGTMRGTGTTIASGTATIGSTGFFSDEILDDARTFRIQGTATLASSSGNWGLAANTADVRVEVASGHSLALAGNVAVYGIQAAVFSVEAGATLSRIGDGTTALGINLQAAGAVHVDGGTLTLTGLGGTFSGDTTIASGATLRIAGRTYAFNGNASISGAGLFDVVGKATLDGAASLIAATSVNTGTLTINTDVAPASLVQIAGRIDGSGNIDVAGSLYWRSGTMAGSGKTTIHGAASVGDVSSTTDEILADSRTLRFAGTAQLASSAGNWGLAADSTQNRIEIASGVTFTVLGEAELYGQAGTLAIETGATFAHNNAGDTVVTWNLDNHGVVAVNAGSMTLLRPFDDTGAYMTGGVYRVANAATLNFNTPVTTFTGDLEIDGSGAVTGLSTLAVNRGRIRLAGGADLAVAPTATFNNTFTDEGTIDLSPGSVFTVNGNMKFAGPSQPTIRTEIASATNFGKVVITGTLDLDSPASDDRFDPDLVGGYDPAAGTRHDVIVAQGGVSNSFDAFLGGTTPSGNALLLARPDAQTVSVATGNGQSAAPHIVSQSFDYQTRQAIVFGFDQDVSAFLTRKDYTIVNLTTGQTLPQNVGTLTYNATNNQAVLTLTGMLADGNYRLTVNASDIANAAGVTLTQGASLDFFVLKGDANHDRTVNFDDLLLLAQNYGKTGRTFAQGNFDYSANGTVDFDDLLIVAQQYSKTLAAPFVGVPIIATADPKKRAAVARETLA